MLIAISQISSIKVGPNTILEVFDNVYFGGIATRVDYSTPMVMKALNGTSFGLSVRKCFTLLHKI